MLTKSPDDAQSRFARFIDFDYSPEQWDAIEKCLQEGMRGPWSARERNALPLAYQKIERSPDERRRLLKDAAIRYFRLLHGPKELPFGQSQKQCEKLVRQIASLRNSIAEFVTVSPRKFDFDHPVSPHKLPRPARDGLTDREGMTWVEALAFLETLESDLRELAHPHWWCVSLYFSGTGHTEPRVVYLQSVLSLWTWFGGRLQISNNSGAITGPLARPAGQLWAIHHLLQPLRSLASGRCLEPDHGRTGCSA
jgi:hypothetical protein